MRHGSIKNNIFVGKQGFLRIFLKIVRKFDFFSYLLLSVYAKAMNSKVLWLHYSIHNIVHNKSTVIEEFVINNYFLFFSLFSKTFFSVEITIVTTNLLQGDVCRTIGKYGNNLYNSLIVGYLDFSKKK